MQALKRWNECDCYQNYSLEPNNASSVKLKKKKSDAVSLKEVNSIKFMLLFKGGSINQTIANFKVFISS